MWAASPRSTRLPCDQRSLTTVRNVVQAGLSDLSGLPPRASAKIFAQRSTDSRSSSSANPAARHTSSRISTITVEASAAYG
ncbi:hypothetical protein SALBM311S_01548 [Streptomyces alboniger]